MSAIAESPVAAIRSDYRRINRSSVLHRLWHAFAVQRERAADRAAARGMLRLEHPGVIADYQSARQFR